MTLFSGVAPEPGVDRVSLKLRGRTPVTARPMKQKYRPFNGLWDPVQVQLVSTQQGFFGPSAF
jgi:hypothetical protein